MTSTHNESGDLRADLSRSEAVRLAQVRLYARNPSKTASFYAALGYAVQGPIEPLGAPDDFPVYHIGAAEGPDIAIFQLAENAVSSKHPDLTLFFFQVEGIRELEKKLAVIGLSTATKEEPRTVRGRINALTDPDGRLVGLDTFFLSRAWQRGQRVGWRPTAPVHYKVGDFVMDSNVEYQCVKDHLAAEGRPPSSLPECWRMVTA